MLDEEACFNDNNIDKCNFQNSVCMILFISHRYLHKSIITYSYDAVIEMLLMFSRFYLFYCYLLLLLVS